MKRGVTFGELLHTLGWQLHCHPGAAVQLPHQRREEP
jgi:hypothetical protein